MGDDLGDHRVVERADDRTAGNARVDADAVDLGELESAEGARTGHVAVVGVLGAQAHLDGMATDLRVQRRVGQGLAGGDRQLQLDQVESGDHLGDRVLDLQAGVHLEEGEVAVAVDQELDRAGADVAHGTRGSCRGIAHGSTQRCVDSRRRGLLDDLLMAALHRAIAFEQRHGVAVLVGEHLDLDVSSTFDEALDEDGAVTERRCGLAFARSDGLVERGVITHDPHAPPAAARRCLDKRG